MNLDFTQRLRKIHRVNRVLWLSVLAGMLVLIVVALLLKYSGIVTGALLQGNPQFDNLMLMLTVGLLFLIFFLKRNYLIPKKLISRATKKNISFGAGDIADLVIEFGDEAVQLAKTLIIMRRYFMLVWSIANIILVFGFIAFILASQFQTFLIYSVISLYSMGINFPFFSLIENSVILLDEMKNTIGDTDV